MTDEELAEIEASVLMLRRGGYSSPADKIERLIAEVRRLKAENERQAKLLVRYRCGF